MRKVRGQRCQHRGKHFPLSQPRSAVPLQTDRQTDKRTNTRSAQGTDLGFDSLRLTDTLTKPGAAGISKPSEFAGFFVISVRIICNPLHRSNRPMISLIWLISVQNTRFPKIQGPVSLNFNEFENSVFLRFPKRNIVRVLEKINALRHSSLYKNKIMRLYFVTIQKAWSLEHFT